MVSPFLPGHCPATKNIQPWLHIFSIVRQTPEKSDKYLTKKELDRKAYVVPAVNHEPFQNITRQLNLQLFYT